MPNILAIETSSDACSVALSKGENSYSVHKVIPQKHTEKLFVILEEVLEKLSIFLERLSMLTIITSMWMNIPAIGILREYV